MDKLSADYEAFARHMPHTEVDHTLIVLKGHLLIEQMLRQFCVDHVFCGHSPNFKYNVLLWIVRAARGTAVPEWVWNAAHHLDRLRNDLAHDLEPRKYAEKLDQFLSSVTPTWADYERFTGPPAGGSASRLHASIFFLHAEVSQALDLRTDEEVISDFRVLPK